MRHTLALSLALIALAATTSWAAIVFPPMMDVHVRSDRPTTNFAGNDTLWLGKVYLPGATYFRAYFQFDPSLLAGQTIHRAVLEIYCFDFDGAGGLPCEAHEVLGPWSESSLTWNNKPAEAPLVLDSQSVGGSMGYISWNITSLVQAWANGAPNHGVMLKHYFEQPAGASRHGLFRSIESAFVDQRPRLVVNGENDTLPIISVSPNQGFDTEFVDVMITGRSFTLGATPSLARAGQTSIPGLDTQVAADGQSLTTTFDLSLSHGVFGDWNVVVTNPSGAFGALPNGFHILHQGPGISVITPAQGADSGSVHVTVAGASFQPGLTARLVRSGQADIPAQNVVVTADGRFFTADFDLRDRLIGPWDLAIVNPDHSSATMPSAFTILLTPHVTSIDPALASNSSSIVATISGQGFAPGASARLKASGESDIPGGSIAVSPDGRTISATFPIGGRPAGFRDVVVTNSNGVSGTLAQAFEIVNGVQAYRITPNSAPNTGSITAELAGYAFDPAAAVMLRRGGESDIVGHDTNVAPDGATLTTTFDLLGRHAGPWDVVVRNLNGTQATLSNGFEVLDGPVSASGLDLSWSACNRAAVPGTGNLDFGCDGTVHRLFANFRSPRNVSDFIALDAVIDLRVADGALPPFWHFESGGCNDGGLAVHDDKPEAQCPSADNGTPWGNGNASDALITAYAPGFGGANHARLLVTVARSASDPVMVTGGQNYYAFHLDLFDDLAATCTGCASPAEIQWSSATLYGVSSSPVSVEGPGLRSNLVTVNGGPTSIGVLSVDPSRAYADGYTPVHINGRNFASAATAHLSRPGFTDVVGHATSVAAGGLSMVTSFNLAQVTSGRWDVVVTNPGGETGRLESEFEVLSRGPVVAVISPNGGEVFRLGESVILRWNAAGDHGVTGVDLYVSTVGSGGPYSVVQLNYPNTGEGGWPATTVSEQCYLKVVAHGGDGLTGEDVSDGAFTVTNSPTATDLALFEAGWKPEGVEVRWRFAKPTDSPTVVERSERETGPWVALAGSPRADGESMVLIDRAASPDATLFYRLVVTEPGGETRRFGPINVPAASMDAVRTSGFTTVGPNPTSGAVRVGYAVARAGLVRLSVIDVMGREIAILAQGPQSVGRHVATWTGAAGAPMGVYFLRLDMVDARMTKRIVVAR